MIVDSNPTPEAAKPTLVTESVNSVCNTGPASVLFIHRGPKVSFFFETESHLSLMLKAVAGRGSSCNKVRPDHPLNELLTNDDSGLIK